MTDFRRPFVEGTAAASGSTASPPSAHGGGEEKGGGGGGGAEAEAEADEIDCLRFAS